MDDSWCLIESDPAVFWDIARGVGVRGVDFQELYTLDQDSLKLLAKDHNELFGLIFLFRWHPSLKTAMEQCGETASAVPPGMFYAKQVIQNSCATQAMLSILLNKRPKLNLGPVLSQFYQFTANMAPDMCGYCLANQNEIREAHNSYRSTSALSIDNASGAKEDPFHFISFVPDDSTKTVYLLDGLRDGPVSLGPYLSLDAWHEKALPVIHKIIESLQKIPSVGDKAEAQTSDIRFNLIAAMPDMLSHMQRQVAELEQQLVQTLRDLLIVESKNNEGFLRPYNLKPVSDCVFDLLASADTSKSAIAAISAQLAELRGAIKSQQDRHQTWEKENALRKHDLLPFYLGALKNLAKKSLLSSAYAKIDAALSGNADSSR